VKSEKPNEVDIFKFVWASGNRNNSNRAQGN
jgi:hypothetical protein